MTEQTPEQQPTNSAEEAQAPAGEDYAGYTNLDEMKKAIYESRKEGKRLAEQNLALTAQLASITRPTPSQRAETRRALDEINDLGLPAETFQQAVQEIAAQTYQQHSAPIAATNAAISDLRATHPSFAKQEGDFNRWLVANPDVAAEYSQYVTESPKAAKRLLLGMYADYETTRKPNPDAEPKKVAPGAKLPSGQSGGSTRRAPDTKLSREEYLEALKDAQRTRDPVALMRKLIPEGTVIHRDLKR